MKFGLLVSQTWVCSMWGSTCKTTDDGILLCRWKILLGFGGTAENQHHLQSKKLILTNAWDPESLLSNSFIVDQVSQIKTLPQSKRLKRNGRETIYRTSDPGGKPQWRISCKANWAYSLSPSTSPLFNKSATSVMTWGKRPPAPHGPHHHLFICPSRTCLPLQFLFRFRQA